MPKSVVVHSAFVSSPGDVASERAIVQRTISELNGVNLHATGHILWPIMWESMSGGVGEDPQDVINRQTPDYDIFLGIIWSRFGTPTNRAGSGTEEEFDRALAFHASDTTALEFMVFVKIADFPNDIDEDQLRSVKGFIKKLKERGVFYRTYRTETEFEALLRQHMHRYLAGVATSSNRATPSTGNGSAEQPHFALLSDIIRFSDSLKKCIDLMKTGKGPKYLEGQRLFHEATIALVADGTRRLNQLIRWTYAYGRMCYTTTQPPIDPAIRKTLMTELNSVRDRIEDWRSLMEKGPTNDSRVGGDFAYARDFLDQCACTVQTSGYGLKGPD